MNFTLSKLDLGDFDSFDIESESPKEYQSFLYHNQSLINKDTKIDKCILSTDLNSSLFVQNHVMRGDEAIVASIQLPVNVVVKNSLKQNKIGDRNICLFKSANEEIIYCLIKVDIPSEYAFEIVERLFGLIDNRCEFVVLSERVSSGLVKDEVPLVRCLSVGIDRVLGGGVVRLEPPNMLSGVAAQVMIHAVNQRRPAVVYAFYRNSLFGMKSDTQISTLMESVLRFHNVTVRAIDRPIRDGPGIGFEEDCFMFA